MLQSIYHLLYGPQRLKDVSQNTKRCIRNVHSVGPVACIKKPDNISIGVLSGAHSRAQRKTSVT